MNKRSKQSLAAFIAAAFLGGGASLFAGEATFDFEGAQAGFEITTNLPDDAAPLRSSGGNPGGYLAITDAAGSQATKVIFPDFDEGLIVKAFEFTADVRIGNGTTDRPADGVSVSYARSSDPVLTDTSAQGGFASNIAEAGTTTGIAVSFDAWAGNTLPDTSDIEGIIVRVDNVTVHKEPLPTRHGAADDVTSAQTGPLGTSGDEGTRGDTSLLSWQPLGVKLDENGRLTVSWKGEAILEDFQTEFFPSPGRLVLAGRTGGANQIQHFDNIQITTVPSETFLITGLVNRPDGLNIEITNAPGSQVQADSIKLTIDGTEVSSDSFSLESTGTFSNLISYNTADDASNGEFFESGSVHTVVIEAADQSGGIQSLTREVVTPSYSTVAAANKAEGVSTADSNGGFRVFAYGTEANNPNRIYWSEEALLGMHGDNLADLFLGPDIDRDGLGDFVNSEASNGFIDSTVINYDRFGVNVGNFQDPDFIDPILTDGTLPGFPGLQSRDTGTGNAILEITTYIEFPERGIYTMGVNSDDGFKASIAPSNRDVWGTVLGYFDGGRGASDTIFRFLVEEGGIYPFRVLWFNGGGGANIELFSVSSDGTKVLVNDRATEGHLKAYHTGGAQPARITKASLNALISGGNVPANQTFDFELQDGSTSVDEASVSLAVNGSSDGVTVSKSGGTTTVSYNPPALLPSNSPVSIDFSYSAGGNTFSASTSATVEEYPTVLAGISSPVGSGSDRGFRWRVHQQANGRANNTGAAEGQLALDPAGAENIADLSAADDAANATFNVSIINFEQGGGEQGNFRASGGGTLGVADELIPGIPGTEGGTDNIAAEALTYVEFPEAGYYRMGVNSDDGFRVTVASDEYDGISPADDNEWSELGVFSGGRGASDTLFSFAVEEAGVYPLRLIWYEGGGGANVEWFTIAADGTRYLINQEGGLKAFRSRSGAPSEKPGKQEIVPDPPTGAPIAWDEPNQDTTLGDLIGSGDITFEPYAYDGGNAEGTFFTGGGGDTGNADLNVVYDSHGWNGGGAEITLEGLMVGEDYVVQLLGAGDTRGCCATRNQAAADDGFGNKSGDFGRGNTSVVGRFTAAEATQVIAVVSGADNGVDPGLSGFILADASGNIVSAFNVGRQAGDPVVITRAGGSGSGGGDATASIANNGDGTVTITYEGTLQSSDSVNGGYADVAGASSPHTVNAEGAARFYRVQ